MIKQNNPYKLLSPGARILATFVLVVVISAFFRKDAHHGEAHAPVKHDTCQASGIMTALWSTSGASQKWCFPECWSYIVCIRPCQHEKVSLYKAINMTLFETVRMPIKSHRNWKLHISLCFTFPLECMSCFLQCCSRTVALRTFLNDPNKHYFEILWSKVLLR